MLVTIPITRLKFEGPENRMYKYYVSFFANFSLRLNFKKKLIVDRTSAKLDIANYLIGINETFNNFNPIK